MGFSLGSYSHLAPMASLGDYPPKGKQHRTRRAVGLTANYRVVSVHINQWVV